MTDAEKFAAFQGVPTTTLAALLGLFTRVRPLLTRPVWSACEAVPAE